MLIVADEQEAADDLAAMVRRWGHTAAAACGAVAALQAATALPADVVLLDYAGDTTEDCRLARRMRLETPRKECFIVAVAEPADDRVEEEQRRRRLAAGIDLMLFKPLDSAVAKTLLLPESVRINGIAKDSSAVPASAAHVLRGRA